MTRALLAALLLLASLRAQADLDHPYPLTSTRYLGGDAGTQVRAGVASGTNGFLVAGIEEHGTARSLRAGIAGADGSWTEAGELSDAAAEGNDHPVAAFNGDGYLVVGRTRTGQVAYRISRFGELVGATALPNNLAAVGGVAWNGSVYAIVGSTNRGGLSAGAVLVVGMTAGGTVIEPTVTLVTPGNASGFAYSSMTIASDGESFLAAFDFSRSCIQCRTARVVRLSGTLQQIGVPTEIDNFAKSVTDLEWGGTEYLLLLAGTGTRAIRIAANGAVLGTSTLPAIGRPRVTWTGNRYAVVGLGSLIYVDSAGNVSPAVTFEAPGSRRDIALPATPGFGRLAIVTAAEASGAPFYGAMRLFVRWVDSQPLPRAPRIIDAESHPGTIVLRWERAPLASGYRIEMSANDGPWQEVERLFGARETTAEISARPGFLRFRMRAWNSGGISDYSNEQSLYRWPRPRGIR